MLSAFKLNTLRGDITCGVTAGVVALPLAIALGVASELGPMAGLYGAIVLGFFAALFGGTPAQISGPTGPMIVVLAGLFAGLNGHVELIFTAVMLAGLLQILCGLVGIGQYIRLVPYPVISGFMTGIGAIIIILQLGRLLGHNPPSGTVAALSYLPEAIAHINIGAFILGTLTLMITYAWPTFLARYVPNALAALICGTFIALFMPSVPMLGDIPTGLPSIQLPVFEQEHMRMVIEAAIILAVLGSIDSLLTSLVADNMTRTRHDSNRELVGQGIGNTVAGLLGGIAGAGATMRTVVNIRSGGQTRLSGMVHALVLLAIVLGLGPLAATIPHAVLAGILVKVGLDIIDWSYLRRAHHGPRWDFALMALVLVLTVFIDLITAVGVGVVLAALGYVRQVAQLQIAEFNNQPVFIDNQKEHELYQQLGEKVSIFSFAGPLSFGAAADLGHHVRQKSVSQTQVLILDFSHVPSLDVSAAMAVETITIDAHRANQKVIVAGANEQVINVLSKLNTQFDSVKNCKSRFSALKLAAELMR